MKIGEVAAAVGTTPRTIRYYEQLGLLAPAASRPGGHRSYSADAVARLAELLRRKELLGLSLEQLKKFLDLSVEEQLALVSARHEEMVRLEKELLARRRRLGSLLRDLESVERPGRRGPSRP
ncbi:MAG: MerR family transcriptional regulator [Solirubrobacterales bacterium]